MPVAAPSPSTNLKIEDLPTLKIGYEIKGSGTDPDTIKLISSVSSNLDSSGKGQILIENYSDLDNATFDADRATEAKEFIIIDIDCGGDPAEIHAVASAYQKLRKAIGNSGAYDQVNVENVEKALSDLLECGTVSSKNSWDLSAGAVRLEHRFKQMGDTLGKIAGTGTYLNSPADDAAHAANVLLDRHVLNIPGPKANGPSLRVTCDIRRAYIELIDGAQSMKFELKDITNPIGDESAIDAQATRLMQKIFGRDLSGNEGYYALLKKEVHDGEALVRDSELFKQLSAEELAVEFNNVKIVDAHVRVTACEQGLKFKGGLIEGKNITSSFEVDGRIECPRTTTYGNVALMFNSPKSKFTDCTFNEGTVITGDLTGSEISSGSHFKGVIWAAKAHGIVIDKVSKSLAGQWKGTLIDERCLEKNSVLFQVLDLVPFEKDPKVISAKIAKILSDKFVSEHFSANGGYVVRSGPELNGFKTLEILEPDENAPGHRKAKITAVPMMGGGTQYKVKLSFLQDELEEHEELLEFVAEHKAEALQRVSNYFKGRGREYVEVLTKELEQEAAAKEKARADAERAEKRGHA